MLHKFLFATALLLSIVYISPATQAQTVTFKTDVGDIVVSLLPDEAPISVANFLGYVERGDYVETIFHRSVPGFVIQGGAFRSDLSSIPLQGPIMNEFGRSNLRGTVAYARQAGMVDSATSQFFFNVSDSNNFLDDIDEGFTVFGEVVSGIEVVDAINNLQRVTLGSAPFTEIPVLDSFNGEMLFMEDLVSLSEVTVLVPGDVNQDGLVNFSDISSFISILSVSGFQEEADVNRDSMVDFADISPFISLLSSQ